MAKQQAVARVEESEAAVSTSREARPPLRPTALTWDFDGAVTRSAVVRLPEHVVLQDLQDDPTLWRSIQAVSQTALRKFDRLLIISFSEDWIVNVLVVEADARSVRLSIRAGDVLRLEANTAEWSDSTYTIRWGGEGYIVVRKADGVRMLPYQYASLEAAKSAAFSQLYPKVAAR